MAATLKQSMLQFFTEFPMTQVATVRHAPLAVTRIIAMIVLTVYASYSVIQEQSFFTVTDISGHLGMRMMNILEIIHMKSKVEGDDNFQFREKFPSCLKRIKSATFPQAMRVDAFPLHELTTSEFCANVRHEALDLNGYMREREVFLEAQELMIPTAPVGSTAMRMTME